MSLSLVPPSVTLTFIITSFTSIFSPPSISRENEASGAFSCPAATSPSLVTSDVLLRVTLDSSISTFILLFIVAVTRFSSSFKATTSTMLNSIFLPAPDSMSALRVKVISSPSLISTPSPNVKIKTSSFSSSITPLKVLLSNSITIFSKSSSKSTALVVETSSSLIAINLKSSFPADGFSTSISAKITSLSLTATVDSFSSISALIASISKFSFTV